MEALESWETPIAGFFIRSHHGVPLVDLENWEVRIDGLVDKPVTLTLKDLKKLPQHTLHAVLECSGNWRGQQKPQVPGVQWGKGAVGNAEWSGVRVSDILKRAGVKPTAKFARVEGADKPALPTTPGFIRSIPLAKMIANETLLAVKMNRQPMPALHGGPLRLILPNWYGHNWIKWVTHITLTDSEDKGFYMAKGYRMPKQLVKPGEKWDSATGVAVEEIRVQSIIVNPTEGQTLGVGNFVVKGKAFSGTGTISGVEVSSDGGGNWNKAAVDSPRSSGGWQEFEISVVAEGTGKMILLSRATDSSGNVQPREAEWNPPGYLRNAVDRVEVEVVKGPVSAEEPLLRTRCLSCHTRELISSQRLSKEAWGKTVTKMEGFGAKFEAGEKERLIDYLARWSTEAEKEGPTPTAYWLEDSPLNSRQYAKGNASRGGGLFKRNCAICHGNLGQGHTAPALTGREIPGPYFWAVVSEGKGDMPGFGETLTRQQVADLSAFIKVKQPAH